MKKLLVLSGKGGTGKTTVAAALIRFSNAGAFADCDVDAPNLHLVAELPGAPECLDYLGSPKAVIHAEKCLCCGVCQAACRFDAIHPDGEVCAVDAFSCEGCGVCAAVCPQDAISLQEDVAGEIRLWTGPRAFSTAELKMGRGNSGKLVSEVKLALTRAAGSTEFAVIDGSPGIGCPVIASMSGVDLALLVAEPSVSGISDLERVLKTAAVFGTKTAVCVNKWDTSPEKTAAIEAFCADKQIPFVGKIPYDTAASAAVNAGRSVAEVDCPAADALRSVYDRVAGMLHESGEGLSKR